MTFLEYNFCKFLWLRMIRLYRRLDCDNIQFWSCIQEYANNLMVEMNFFRVEMNLKMLVTSYSETFICSLNYTGRFTTLGHNCRR